MYETEPAPSCAAAEAVSETEPQRDVAGVKVPISYELSLTVVTGSFPVGYIGIGMRDVGQAAVAPVGVSGGPVAWLIFCSCSTVYPPRTRRGPPGPCVKSGNIAQAVSGASPDGAGPVDTETGWPARAP